MITLFFCLLIFALLICIYLFFYAFGFIGLFVGVDILLLAALIEWIKRKIHKE